MVEKGGIDVANDEDEEKGEHGVGGVDRDIVVEGSCQTCLHQTLTRQQI